MLCFICSRKYQKVWGLLLKKGPGSFWMTLPVIKSWHLKAYSCVVVLMQQVGILPGHNERKSVLNSYLQGFTNLMECMHSLFTPQSAHKFTVRTHLISSSRSLIHSLCCFMIQLAEQVVAATKTNNMQYTGNEPRLLHMWVYSVSEGKVLSYIDSWKRVLVFATRWGR